MSIKITICDNCKSTNIKEINPESIEFIKKPLCKINCICNECGFRFTISSWTKFGRRIGIMY